MQHLRSRYTKVYLDKIVSEAKKKRLMVKSVRHITPRAYCIAKPSAHFAVFVVPVEDREPQVRDSDTTCVQNDTCQDIKVGDWAVLAYVTSRSGGEPIVVMPA